MGRFREKEVRAGEKESTFYLEVFICFLYKTVSILKKVILTKHVFTRPRSRDR